MADSFAGGGIALEFQRHIRQTIGSADRRTRDDADLVPAHNAHRIIRGGKPMVNSWIESLASNGVRTMEPHELARVLQLHGTSPRW